MTAVSYQRVADYERRRVRAQPDYGVGDLVGLADASDRLFRGDPIPFSDLPPVKGFLADAASAGFRVGYEDPLYFSRDYKKYFGDPPQSDIANLALTRSLELCGKECAAEEARTGYCFHVSTIRVITGHRSTVDQLCEPSPYLAPITFT